MLLSYKIQIICKGIWICWSLIPCLRIILARKYPICQSLTILLILSHLLLCRVHTNPSVIKQALEQVNITPLFISYYRFKNEWLGVSIAVFASNCGNAGAKLRTKYLEELMSYLPIHSYGRCKNNRAEPDIPYDPKWPSIAQRRARKIHVLSQYRFYLAFENAPIEDYVSEKVFEGLLAGTIPIYRGAPGINAFMPSSKSFINANNFTARQLADEILRINGSETIYEEYMQFKQQPLPDSFYQISNMSYVHPNVVRRICDKAKEVKK